MTVEELSGNVTVVSRTWYLLRLLLKVAASALGLAVLGLCIVVLVEHFTPLETKLAKERTRFYEYQRSKDRFQYIRDTELALQIPAKYFLYDYANIDPDSCFNDKNCAKRKPVEGTYFSFAWPSGIEQDYETAFNPLHPDRIRVELHAKYDESLCRPGGWVRACQGEPAAVLAQWDRLHYLDHRQAPVSLYGLTCHAALPRIEWLCFGSHSGLSIIMAVTLKDKSGWPPNPGTNISFLHRESGKPTYVTLYLNSKHVEEWPRLVDRAQTLISSWKVAQ